MSSGQNAVITVCEERARIRGVEVTKKTVIAATAEGFVWVMHVALSRSLVELSVQDMDDNGRYLKIST